jgi:hypothetical protein
MMEEIRITGIVPNLEKHADHDDASVFDDTQQKVARHSVYRGAMSCMPPLFELFAGLWVFLYEQAVPKARSEAQQGLLLDELHASTAKLRIRRDELHARIKASAADAKKVHAKGDTRGLKSRLIVIRRLRTQVERIESSLLTIETNIDEIINSDVTREIIDSLRRSTEAMKGQVLPMGGVEGVQVSSVVLGVLGVMQDVMNMSIIQFLSHGCRRQSTTSRQKWLHPRICRMPSTRASLPCHP